MGNTFLFPFQEYKNISTYLETPAVITASDWKFEHGTKGRTKRAIDFCYRYQHNGISYSSARYDVPGKVNISVPARQKEFLAANPVGKKITCFINPAKPGCAVISPTFNFSRNHVIFCAILGLFTLGGCVLFLWGRFDRDKKITI